MTCGSYTSVEHQRRSTLVPLSFTAAQSSGPCRRQVTLRQVFRPFQLIDYKSLGVQHLESIFSTSESVAKLSNEQQQQRRSGNFCVANQLIITIQNYGCPDRQISDRRSGMKWYQIYGWNRTEGRVQIEEWTKKAEMHLSGEEIGCWASARCNAIMYKT